MEKDLHNFNTSLQSTDNDIETAHPNIAVGIPFNGAMLHPQQPAFRLVSQDEGRVRIPQNLAANA